MTPNGPILWDAILDEMPPKAVIAGGAVRDFFLGVRPKDIDVFYGSTPLSNPDELFNARCGLERIDNIYERQEEYSSLSLIDLVSRGELFGWRVDAVALCVDLAGRALVEMFDFAINQFWYIDGQVQGTRAALRDLQGHTVTLLTNDRRERSDLRFARFNEQRGGNWTYVA